MMNRFTLFISNEAKIEIHKRSGIGNNVTMKVDDAEIRIPEDKLKELWYEISKMIED